MSKKQALPLHWRILIGLAAGTLWAVISGFMGWSSFTVDYIAPFGTIFINLLKLIAVPLVLFSIISGIGGLGSPEQLGRLGAKTLAAYLATTITAVSLGLLLVNLLKPGNAIDDNTRIERRIAYELWAKAEGKIVLDEECFHCNPAYASHLASVESRQQSELSSEDLSRKKEKVDERPLSFFINLVPENIFLALTDNRLMLQTIFFGLFFGISLLFLPGTTGSPVLQLVQSLNAVFLKMVDIVMQASPALVFALMAGLIADLAGDDLGKIADIFKGLSFYALVVILGLLFLGFGIYPLLIKIFAKGTGFFDFLKKISPAQLLAFSTSSSAATLPVTLDCVENRVGVDSKIAGFVLPIGATVNMDGTSLYQAVAVIFLAQMHMVDLSLGQQLTIVVTATLASIGSAAVPSAGIIMLIIVMESVQLNPAWIGIILPIDRILDMCRTVVNVTGDATVSTMIAQSENMLHPPKVNE